MELWYLVIILILPPSKNFNGDYIVHIRTLAWVLLQHQLDNSGQFIFNFIRCVSVLAMFSNLDLIDPIFSLDASASGVGPQRLRIVCSSSSCAVSWRRWHCEQVILRGTNVSNFVAVRSAVILQVRICHRVCQLMSEHVGVVCHFIGEMAALVTVSFCTATVAEIWQHNIAIGSSSLRISMIPAPRRC